MIDFSKARQRLIVALDVPSEEEALELTAELRDSVGYFKVGLQLFTLAGPRIVERILQEGSHVFLDLKLHDIPNTVAGAVTEACEIGAGMLTLHTSGGESMLRAARESADRWREASGRNAPRLLGVTILTSLTQQEVDDVGFGHDIEGLVLRLARLASACRLDGMVSSPLELDRLRSGGVRDLLFVTPGIRPSSADAGDQRRIMTPARAIAAGSSYLVVGRPITRAGDPAAAARALVKEIQEALPSEA